MAIEEVIPEIIGFSNDFPNGKTILDCTGTGSSSMKIQDTTTTLLQNIKDVYCGILRIFGDLESGQQTTEPNHLSTIVQGIWDDVDKVSSSLVIAMPQLGTVVPPATQSTTVIIIPGPPPPIELTSIASTTTALPPGKDKDPGRGKDPGDEEDPEKEKDLEKEDGPEKEKDPGDKEDPGKGNDPGQEGEPAKTDNNSEHSSTTQSSSTCTTTVSATYASVFCSVMTTAGSRQGRENRRRQQSTGCSTIVYSTGTACNTLSPSTDTSFLPEETWCSPNNCGASSCARGKRSLQQQLKKRAVPARDRQPEANKRSDPRNYNGDQKKLIRGGKLLPKLHVLFIIIVF